MDNPTAEKLRTELNAAKRQYVAFNTRIVCAGSLVITVLPNLNAETATSYQLEMYKNITVTNEFPFAILFVTSVLGVESLRRVGGTIKKLFFDGTPFARDYNQFHVKGFVKNGKRTLLIVPILGNPKQ